MSSIEQSSSVNKPRKKLQDIQNWIRISWDKQKNRYVTLKDRFSSSGISLDINSMKRKNLQKSTILDRINENDQLDKILREIKAYGDENFLEISQSDLKKLRKILNRKAKDLKAKLSGKDPFDPEIHDLNNKIYEIRSIDRFLLEKTLSNYIWSYVLPNIVQVLSLGMVAWQVCDSVAVADGGCLGIPEPMEEVSGLALIPDDPLSACSDVICGGNSQYDDIRFGSEHFGDNNFDTLTEEEVDAEFQLSYDVNITSIENNQHLIEDSEPLDIDINLLKTYYSSSKSFYYALGLSSIFFSVTFVVTFLIIFRKRYKNWNKIELRKSDMSLLSFSQSRTN